MLIGGESYIDRDIHGMKMPVEGAVPLRSFAVLDFFLALFSLYFEYAGHALSLGCKPPETHQQQKLMFERCLGLIT